MGLGCSIPSEIAGSELPAGARPGRRCRDHTEPALQRVAALRSFTGPWAWLRFTPLAGDEPFPVHAAAALSDLQVG